MKVFAAVVFISAIAVPVAAQTQPLVNPSAAIFTASLDHAAVDLGTPILTDYAVEFVVPGQTAPVQSLSIGKPAPVANEITVDLTALRPKLTLLKPGTYVLQVVARGPGGNAASTASVPFTLAPRGPVAPGSLRLQPFVAKATLPGSSNSPSQTAAALSATAQ